MSPSFRISNPRDAAVVALAVGAVLDLGESVATLMIGWGAGAPASTSPIVGFVFAVIGVAFIGVLALGLYTRFVRIFAVLLALLTAASTWGVIALPGDFTVLSGVDVLLGVIAVGGLILTVAAPRGTAHPAMPTTADINT